MLGLFWNHKPIPVQPSSPAPPELVEASKRRRDEAIRMAALQAASRVHYQGSAHGVSVLEQAKKYEAWIKGEDR